MYPKIVLCQLDSLVGDFQGNLKKVLDTLQKHRDADLIIFPESFITGYGLGDLLFNFGFDQKIEDFLETIQKNILHNQEIIIGTPYKIDGVFYNVSFHITNKSKNYYKKQKLAVSEIFDEGRYFTTGSENYFFEVKGVKFSVLICEDVWDKKILDSVKNSDVDCLIAINASCYTLDKKYLRKKLFENFPKNYIYLNLIGGQDEMVFDGGSFAKINDKHIELASFKEETYFLDYENPHFNLIEKTTQIEDIYNAITLGFNDFYYKNNFKNVVLGISGGIDSAIVLALISKIVPKENINCFMLSYKYTTKESIELANKLCKNLGVSLVEIKINETVDLLTNTLNIEENSLAMQNIQSRVRGLILMTQANLLERAIVLNTSNKSEIAMGYSTLYGDSVGGFSPIKDLCKTRVYELALYINREEEVIPSMIITRSPSAELAENQCDQDDLPPYKEIDEFIECIVENNENYISPNTDKMLLRLKNSEFKRIQFPPGVKLTKRSFARLDWRNPIVRY